VCICICMYIKCKQKVLSQSYRRWNYTTTQEKKCFMNRGLLKSGFWVVASCRVKKICEMSSMSFNMGCCMCEQGLPAWLENSTYCMNDLNSALYSSLQDVDLQTRIYLWFMHDDDAPPHSLLAVWEFLNSAFPKQFIGRGHPTAWPAPSPDLFFSFFMSGHT